MSAMDDTLSPSFVVAVAATTVELHDAGRRCPCCTDTSCPQDAWAQQVLAEHRAARANTTPHHRPAADDDRRNKEHSMSKWIRPNRCDNSGPNCVEVAADETTGERSVRDSKNPTGPVLTFTAQEWTAFEQSVRAGQQF